MKPVNSQRKKLFSTGKQIAATALFFIKIQHNRFSICLGNKMALIQKASLALAIALISTPFLLLSGCKHTNQNQKPKATSDTSTFGIPEIPDSFRLAMSRYQNTRGTELEDWGPDGKGVVVLKRTEQTNQIFFAEKPGPKFR